jgi:NTP pyrophosphatase (non-canonical NTP hydrolase)
MKIETMTKQVVEWISQYIPDNKRNPMNTAIKLSEEVSELLHAIHSGEGNVGHELADIFILTLDIAHLKGYNLEDEFLKKMDINRMRRWNQEKGALKHD